MNFPQRLPFPDFDNLTPEQTALRERMGPRRGGPNASKMMKFSLHFPIFIDAVGALGSRVADNSSLPPRLFQIACMRTVWLCNGEYLWSQHRLAGLKIGITDTDLFAVAQGPDADGLEGLDRAVVRAVDELHFDHRFSDESWTGFDAELGPDAKVDILLTYTNYVAFSAMANSMGVPLEDGQAGFAPELVELRRSQ